MASRSRATASHAAQLVVIGDGSAQSLSLRAHNVVAHTAAFWRAVGEKAVTIEDLDERCTLRLVGHEVGFEGAIGFAVADQRCV